jgi:hypothetical protein
MNPNTSRSDVADSVFARKLSEPLEAALLGPLRPLLDLVRERNLDFQIRPDYFNIYDGRCSVLKLKHSSGRFRATIDRKYGAPAGLLEPFDTSTTSAWTRHFVDAFPSIKQLARGYDKKEGAAEFRIACANRKAPLIIIDRQVQLPGEPPSRVDLLGLCCGDGGPASIVLIELKEGRSLQLKRVLEQVQRYHTFYVQEGHLRGDVAASLEQVVKQKIRLGLLDQFPTDVSLSDLPVELLVAWVSRDVRRPMQNGWKSNAPTRVAYVGLGSTDSIVPPRSCWELLQGPELG